MKRMFLFLTLLCFSNSTLAGITVKEEQRIIDAISENDISLIKSTLKSHRSPFRCKAKGLGKILGNKQPSQYCTSDLLGGNLIKAALNHKPCRDEIALILLNNGARLDNGTRYGNINLIQSTFEIDCPKATEYLISHATNNEIEIVFDTYTKVVKSHINRFVEGVLEGRTHDTKELDSKNFKFKTSLFKSYADKQCPKFNQNLDSCSMSENLMRFQKELDKILEVSLQKQHAIDKEYEQQNSPEGIANTICELEIRIKTAKSEIDRQKKIGKISGTVNLNILNEAGQEIVDSEILRNNLQKHYRTKTKKDFNLKKCSF